MDAVGMINARINAAMTEATAEARARVSVISSYTGISFSSQLARATSAQASVSSGETQDSAFDTQPTETQSAGTQTVETQTPVIVPSASFDRSALDDLAASTAARHGVDAALVRALIWAESSDNPNDVSGAGAVGLMQLMPATAEALGVADSYDPAQNIDGGTRYLASLLERYNGDYRMAVAGYNCGSAGLTKRGVTALNTAEELALLPEGTRILIRRVEEYIATNGYKFS